MAQAKPDGGGGGGAAASEGGGGVDPVIGAAGLSAAAGLFTALMNQNAQREAQERAERLAREEAARQRLAQAQQDQLKIVGGMGQGEQNALGTLIATLQKTAR